MKTGLHVSNVFLHVVALEHFSDGNRRQDFHFLLAPCCTSSCLLSTTRGWKQFIILPTLQTIYQASDLLGVKSCLFISAALVLFVLFWNMINAALTLIQAINLALAAHARLRIGWLAAVITGFLLFAHTIILLRCLLNWSETITNDWLKLLESMAHTLI